MSTEHVTWATAAQAPAAERAKHAYRRALHVVLRTIRRFIGPALRGSRFGSLDAERIEGWTTRAELNWLWRQARRRHVIIEIGSWKGRSTHALASATPGIVLFVEHFHGSHDNSRESYHEAASPQGSDFVRQTLLANLAGFIQRGRALLIEMNSVEAAKALAPILTHRRADMIFIDGEHSYEGVKRDILSWRPFLQLGGLFCGHDSDWPSVRQALNEMLPEWQRGPGSIWYIDSARTDIGSPSAGV